MDGNFHYVSRPTEGQKVLYKTHYGGHGYKFLAINIPTGELIYVSQAALVEGIMTTAASSTLTWSEAKLRTLCLIPRQAGTDEGGEAWTRGEYYHMYADQAFVQSSVVMTR